MNKKLTKKDADLIRKKYNCEISSVTMKTLASQYNVSRVCIGSIIQNISWYDRDYIRSKKCVSYTKKEVEKRKDIIIAVDIDGVQRDFLSSLEKTYDKYHPANNRIPVVEWNLAKFFPTGKKIWEFIYKDHSEEIFMNALPYGGMVSFMNWLYERFTIIIITAQPDPKSEKYAKEWLIKNNIKFDNFYCTFEKESLSYHIMIEDSPIMISKIKKEGKTVLRIVRPWNVPVDGVPSIRNIKELKFKINELTKEM